MGPTLYESEIGTAPFIARGYGKSMALREASLKPNFEPAPTQMIERLKPFLLLGRRWHDHEVVGLDRIAPKSPALLAINHSLATYDTLLLCGVIIERLGRVPSGLGDRLIFKTPRLRRIATAAGIVEATHENGAELLRRNRLVIVAPGGMREALRQSDERYRVRWDRRKGFVRLALRTGAPIQLVACPNADRMYRVYESDLTKLVYKRLRAPVPLIRGWGPTLIPRPVKLLHLIGERMQPEALDEARFEEQVDDWHATVQKRMEALMLEARELAR